MIVGKHRSGVSMRRLLSEINVSKYRQAPTKEEVEKKIRSFNMSERRFEKFFGLGDRAINNYKRQGVPKWSWHIFFEDNFSVKTGVAYWEEKFIEKNRKREKRKNKKASRGISDKIKRSRELFLKNKKRNGTNE